MSSANAFNLDQSKVLLFAKELNSPHYISESKPKKEKKKDKKSKKRKNAKINDNDEAVEESDEGDFDDRELDYISDSGRFVN